MKLTKINKNIKCDTIMCHELSPYKLEIESYKGDIYLCENCFKKLANLIKKEYKKNDQNK